MGYIALRPPSCFIIKILNHILSSSVWFYEPLCYVPNLPTTLFLTPPLISFNIAIIVSPYSTYKCIQSVVHTSRGWRQWQLNRDGGSVNQFCGIQCIRSMSIMVPRRSCILNKKMQQAWRVKCHEKCSHKKKEEEGWTPCHFSYVSMLRCHNRLMIFDLLP